MKTKTLSIFIIVFYLIGCSATNPVILYEGAPLARGDVAVISALGLYPDRKLSLTIKKIDGKAVSAATEIHLLPGTYNLNVFVWKDLAPGWPSTSWKELYVDKIIKVEKGHTYIPQAVIEGDNAQVIFLDKGLGYPEECNPFLLYQAKKPHDFCEKRI